MGLFRKLTSVSTLGLVDFRSAKDRTAAYTRGTRKQARKQTKIMRTQTSVLRQHYAQPVAPPPGWYVDQVDTRFLRWFDGRRMTDMIKPIGS